MHVANHDRRGLTVALFLIFFLVGLAVPVRSV